ncbi:MAG: GSCFA domain-containing protein [Capnocytophaga sp.]|nr:GSCFA domain-containing protein [Capnocytophaga sp.]
MQFFTSVPITTINEEQKITYQSDIVSIGSCFADNISQKLTFYKWDVFSNPFGVIFQPLAIENLLKRTIFEEYFTEKDIFFYDELWHSFEVHSECSFLKKEDILIYLNKKIEEFSLKIEKSTHFIITLGTAWAYWHKENKYFVANCHKVPQREFQKKVLSVTQILDSLQKIESYIKQKNPKINIIFTISPVRHLKDGFVENQYSKSLLFCALHQFLEDKKNNCFYFPAYEILMDELRDYRFYAEDLVHPSAQAIEYIWERFLQTFIHSNCLETMKEVKAITQGLAHRAQNPNSPKHQLFLQNIHKKIEKLQKQNPKIKF